MLSAAPDAAFPFRVCGMERSQGAVCVSSVGPAFFNAEPDLQAAFPARWPALVPDPLDAEVLFGGNLVRYDRRLGQAAPVAPPIGAVAPTLAAPTVFAADGKTLYYGGKTLWRSTTGAQSWIEISSDLTAGGVGDAISALAVSPVAARVLWAGTTDGLIQVSVDSGATWVRRSVPATAGRVTPVASIEGSHFDVNSAYVVVDQGDSSRSNAYRTRDAGETWKPLLADVSSGRVHVIREDGLRRGLLFAGTDRGMYMSFDDGERWMPLQLDLPASGVLDLFIRDIDLVVATAGRGFWILRDISPLRQVTADVLRAATFLFRPATAWRIRTTAGSVSNPSMTETEGVAFHYLIGAEPPPMLTLEVIATASGEVLRRFTSDAPATSNDWLDKSPGLHRKMWNLRYSSPGAMPAAAPDVAMPIPGVRVLPNAYQVRLTAGTRVLRQAVNIRMDPRVRATTSDIAAGFTLAKSIADKQRQLFTVRDSAPARPPTTKKAALDDALSSLNDVARTLQQFDGRPTPTVDAAAAAAIARADAALSVE
jgi:hypothetical protein